MKKKKMLFVLLSIITALFLDACSDDEKDEPKKDYPSIIGTWAEVETEELEYVSSTLGISWTFATNGYATQRLWLIVNGVTMKDVRVQFSYTYDGKNITTTSTSGKTVVHSVSIVGDTMKFGDGEGGYFNLIKQ